MQSENQLGSDATPESVLNTYYLKVERESTEPLFRGSNRRVTKYTGISRATRQREAQWVITGFHEKLWTIHSNLWFDKDDRALRSGPGEAARSTRNLWAGRIRPWTKKHELTRYLEIGVCEGRSLREMAERGGMEYLVAVDPWEAPLKRQEPSWEVYFRNALINVNRLQQAYPGSVFNVCREPSRIWFEKNAGRATFDVIYVDGDHRGPFAMQDLVNAFWSLNPNGVLIVDDTNRRWVRSDPNVWEAASGFELAHSAYIETLYKTNGQWAWVKTKNP
jgi:hypothetical protein